MSRDFLRSLDVATDAKRGEQSPSVRASKNEDGGEGLRRQDERLRPRAQSQCREKNVESRTLELGK